MSRPWSCYCSEEHMRRCTVSGCPHAERLRRHDGLLAQVRALLERLFGRAR